MEPIQSIQAPHPQTAQPQQMLLQLLRIKRLLQRTHLRTRVPLPPQHPPILMAASPIRATHRHWPPLTLAATTLRHPILQLPPIILLLILRLPPINLQWIPLGVDRIKTLPQMPAPTPRKRLGIPILQISRLFLIL